jgi:hypothetical protein
MKMPDIVMALRVLNRDLFFKFGICREQMRLRLKRTIVVGMLVDGLEDVQISLRVPDGIQSEHLGSKTTSQFLQQLTFPQSAALLHLSNKLQI